MMRETIFAPVGEAASARARMLRQPESRGKVYFKTEVQSGSVYLIFSRPDSRDPSVDSAGNYIIKRSLKDGSFLQAKIFVQDDPGCFARLFPMDGRTGMDIFISGEPFQKGIVIAQPFDRLLTAPFSTIIELTSGVVDWSLVLPAERTAADMRVERIVGQLRPRLKMLADVEDGAMDGSGRFIYIRDGRPQAGRGGFNCSGFAKFVVDGFSRPLAGRLMDIQDIKERDLDARGNRWSPSYEESRDPYFGLDWSRNLARMLQSARTGEPLPPPEFADVRDVERFPYVEDVGYPIENLTAIFYILARRDPGVIYLGSLNREAGDGAPVRQHHHLAVFFPYIDGSSRLRIVVMERNLETSVASLQRRFPRDSVHLVRIDTEGEFSLP
jgi:hypothetical protein